MTRDSKPEVWPRWMQWVTAALCVLAVCSAATVQAGVPECGNMRLQDVGSCELTGEVQCTGSCQNLGIYKKACATKLHTVCSSECTFKADITCTDDCTEICTESCDRGVNVICIHNCFGECTGSCEADCVGAADDVQCRATCEANCDIECDITCKPLVDGSCYKHCVECCGGSCTAAANLDCQTSCQEVEFEQCEYEFRGECEASCEAEGALFCDGEYVMSGSEVGDCVTALAAIGLDNIEVDAGGHIDLERGIAEGKASVGCSVGSVGSGSTGGLFVALALLLCAYRRRVAQ